jgi:peptidoglycan-associated lipoprotein
MRSTFTVALLAGTAALAAACASQPEPEPTPVVTAPVTTPRPAPVTPGPTQPSGPAAGSKADFAAKATDRVYFALDQYTLDDASRRALQGQATWLTQYPSARVQIEGNADERGTREYNLALGARRAESVAAYLSSLGVNASRIETVSFGKDKPMNPGHSEEAWSQNRNAYTNVVSEAVS